MKPLIVIVAACTFGVGCSQVRTVEYPPITTSLKMDGMADDWATIQHVESKFGGGEEHAQTNFKPHLDIDPVLVASDANYLYLFLRLPVTLAGHAESWTQSDYAGEIWVDVDGGSYLDVSSTTGFFQPFGVETRLLYHTGVAFPISMSDADGNRSVYRGRAQTVVRIENAVTGAEYSYQMPWENRQEFKAGEMVLEVGHSDVWKPAEKSNWIHLWLYTHHNLIAHGDDGIEVALPLDLIGVRDAASITLYMKDEASTSRMSEHGSIKKSAYSVVTVGLPRVALTATDGPKRLDLPPPEIVRRRGDHFASAD